MRSRVAGVARLGAARRRIIASLAAVAALAALLGAQSVGATTTPTSGPLTPSLARRLSQNVNQHVIVILKSQPAAAHVGSSAAARRANAVLGAQAPLMRELRAVRATHVKSFQLVDAFAATVSKGEAARLRANRAVAEVIPDVTIHGAAPRSDADRRLSQVEVAPIDDTHAERDPGRLLRRQAAARSRGLSLDRHGLRQPGPADRPVARHHGCGRQGRLDRRRHRSEQHQLHPAEQHARPSSTTRTSPATAPASSPAATRLSSTPTRSPARASIPTTSTGSAPSRIRRPATSASRAWLRAPASSASTCSARSRTRPSPTSCRRSTTRSRPTTST